MALPLLLAGPILRRAEPERVCVWLVTSSAVAIGAHVFSVGAGEAGQKPIGAGIAETIALGQRLFIHLVSIHPNEGSFPTDELLAYDIELRDDRGSKGLKDLGLTKGDAAITYEGFSLPTFFLRRRTPELTLLHGSCRGLRGKGEDALACGDKVVASHVRDLSKRPSALFLTGDQIYGDDVSGPLIKHLTTLGNELLGWDEDGSIPGLPKLSEIPAYGRKEIAQQEVKLTSDKCRNHLIGFGEYAAMYLTAWSETWPNRFPEFEEAVAGLGAGRLRKMLLRRKYKKELEAIRVTHESLPRVRRLLANVPTYMIFDDHDVTDDWNLTEEVRRGMKDSPSGRRVVANALAAFWAFQAWGNHPEGFDDSFKKTVAAYLTQDADVDASTYEEALWSVKGWWYHAPTNPPAICMDTRTQRGYDSPGGAPRLLSDEGLQWLKKTVTRSGYERGDPLIIVSPVPVFGIELQERRQKFLATKIRATKIDLEAWHSNLRGFVELQRVLIGELGLTHCLILSGDVHYGFNATASFETQHGKLQAVQLVSSALRHGETTSELLMNALGRAVGHEQNRLGWEEPPDLGSFAPLKKKLIRRAPNLDEWNGAELSFLAEHRVHQLGIEDPPDYKESKRYVALSGTSSTLVGENNLGLVSLLGHEVTHTHLTSDAREDRPNQATMQVWA
ncbi:MAG: hypothetical protein ACRDJS_03150 [Actinomycetota bacterium]